MKKLLSRLGKPCSTQAGIEFLLVNARSDAVRVIIAALKERAFISQTDDSQAEITVSLDVCRPWPESVWEGLIDDPSLISKIESLRGESWVITNVPFGLKAISLNHEFMGMTFDFISNVGLVLRFMTGLRDTIGMEAVLEKFREEFLLLRGFLSDLHGEPPITVIYAEGRRVQVWNTY